jgi:hypothetical protein
LHFVKRQLTSEKNNGANVRTKQGMIIENGEDLPPSPFAKGWYFAQQNDGAVYAAALL